MELRRVQEVGGGTAMVSLPKEWAARNGVRKGTLISIQEGSADRLVLAPFSGEREMNQATLAFNPNEQRRLLGEITGFYLLGYDVIKIQGSERVSYDVREAIKGAMSHLVGLEIVEEDAYSITTQFLLDSSNLAPSKIFRRMHSIVNGMQADIVTSLVEGDKRMMKVIPDRDDEVDRLYFLLVRTIRSAVIDPMLAARYSISQIDCLDFRVAANVLESIGDTNVSMAKIIMELPHPIELTKTLGVSVLEINQLLVRMLDLGLDSLLSKNADNARETVISYNRFSKGISSLREKASSELSSDISPLNGILDGMSRIAQSSVDIADLSVPFYPVVR